MVARDAAEHVRQRRVAACVVQRMPRLVQERLIVVETALGARDQMDDLRRVARDHTCARRLLRTVVEIELDVRLRHQVEAERGRESRGRSRSRGPSCRSPRAARAGACTRCGSSTESRGARRRAARANHFSRSAPKARVGSRRSRASSARDSSRSEMSFSSSLRSTASAIPESSAASSSVDAEQVEPVVVEVALASAWIAPSSSRSAYAGSTASCAWAFRSGISSPLNVTRVGEQAVLELVLALRQLRRRSARTRTSCGAGTAARARRPTSASSASWSASSCSRLKRSRVAANDLSLLRRSPSRRRARRATPPSARRGSARGGASNSVGLRTRGRAHGPTLASRRASSTRSRGSNGLAEHGVGERPGSR